MGMYDLNILLKLKENNISINKYILLKIIEDCSLSLFKEEYLQKLVNLKTEGLLNAELELTTKAIELLQTLEGNVKKSVNYEQLHKKLQEKLKELTGKKQYMVNGKYAFLPNYTDFNTKLKQVIVKYKLKDLNKIKKLLTLHIEKSVKDNFKYSILLGYYISKDGKSTLATDYESFEENEKEEIKENIEPKEIKNLF